jgi:hypothetical protein
VDQQRCDCGYGDGPYLRITEAELARDLHAVLAKVQEGVEVIVEQHPVTIQTAYLVGQMQGQEASKGNVLPF